ncbi:MAG: arginine--tRNA ligase [Candidatus Uhrbacteria bacterium]
MSTYSEAKQKIIKELKVALGKGYSPTAAELETPPDSTMGDFAFPCFTLAKGLKKNPAEIAVEVSAKIEPKGWIEKVTAKGSYVNFFLRSEAFGKNVLEEINLDKENYGKAKEGRKRRVMVEYVQPNTHKEVHVGHVRNFFIGHTVVNLLNSVGYEVVPACYIGDVGAHVAKCLWALKKFHAEEKPDNWAKFLGEVYTEASQYVEDHPEVKEEISVVQRELEAGKSPWVSLWRKTRKYSLNMFKDVFKELGLPIDVWYFESEVEKDGKKIVQQLLKKGVAQESQGAIIVDLEKEGLGVYLILKTDGSALYSTKDLALAYLKEAQYHPDRSILVVDSRQSLVLQQLFATLRRVGFKKDFTHLSYDFVTLKEGAMSSRKGNIIRYENFRDTMIEASRAETKKRHPEWKDKKVEETARLISFAAIRFGMLRQDPAKKIVFDMEEAMSFDGYTGPYLLYTYARAQSILRKAGSIKPKIETKKLSLPIEHKIFFKLSEYPEVVLKTSQDFKLDRLTEYLFDLAKTFATFYHEVPVTQAEDKETVAARLALIESVSQVLKNGLWMMGIETIKEM